MKKRSGIRAGALALGGLIALVVIVGVQAQAGVIIDDFSTGSQSFSATAPNSNFQSVAAANAIGGDRDVILQAGGSPGRRLDFDVFLGTSSMVMSQQNSEAGTTTIQWDGSTDSTSTLDHTGLGGVDLTTLPGGRGTGTGVHVRVVDLDLGVSVRVRIYTDASNWSQVTQSIPGGTVNTSYYLPFSSFTIGGGSGATFSNVGAVELFVDGTINASADLELALVESTGRDFGDLPAAYSNTLETDDGARHILGDLRLGTLLDAEADGQPSPGATLDGSDEDGVTPTGNWSDGDGHVTIESTGFGCMNAWVDMWNGTVVGPDNDFGDPNENIIPNQLVVTGTNYFTFTVPVVADDETWYGRFRLAAPRSDNSCGGQTLLTPTGQTYDGEVEDYEIMFGPTAVTFSSFEAHSNASWPLLAGAAAVLGLGISVLFFQARRRRRA